MALVATLSKPRTAAAGRSNSMTQERILKTLTDMGMWGDLRRPRRVAPPKATRTRGGWPIASAPVSAPAPVLAAAAAAAAPAPAAEWSCGCEGGAACRSRAHRGRDRCGAQQTATDKKYKVRVCGSCRRNKCEDSRKKNKPEPKTVAAPPPPTLARPVYSTNGLAAGRFYFCAALNIAVGPADNYDAFCSFVNAPTKQFCVASDRSTVPGSAVRVPDSCDAKVADLLAIYRELQALVASNSCATYLCCNMGEVRSVALFIRLVATETGVAPATLLHELRTGYSERVMPDRAAVTMVFGPFAGLDLLGARR